ncbi:MAG: type IV secretory system conjugative DNA transfer family protein [Clostridia bacterium]|nr:type IV secretory system conjugative DNA transfer family protein [Clostridia bacterium]
MSKVVHTPAVDVFGEAWQEISQIYGSAVLNKAADLLTNGDPRTIAVKDLHKHENTGVLISLQRDSKGKLYASFTPDTHSLIVGATRSGKTTSFIKPMIRLSAMRKDKPSMLTADPKGELYRASAAYLRSRGYRVVLFNFRDAEHTACWNPLLPIYENYQLYCSVADSVTTEFTDGKAVNYFKGKPYTSEKQLQQAIELERHTLMSKVESAIDEFALKVVLEQKKDPQWSFGAREIFKGVICALMEDTVLTPDQEKSCGRKRVTADQFTIRNIILIINELAANQHNDIITNRPAESLARRHAQSYIEMSANVTKAGYFAELTANISRYNSSALLDLTSSNTLDFNSLDDGPVAVFIIYRDEEKSHYAFVNMLVQQFYNALIALANKRVSDDYENDGRLSRPFYFIWDEFGNFPRIDDISSKITACGSRNIWLHLVIQSYSQLKVVYGEEYETILGNCNLQIYFGSNDFVTKQRISEQCLTRTVLSPLSAFNGNEESIMSYNVTEVPLVSVATLSHMRFGDAYVMCLNEFPLLAHFERDYMCPELTGVKESPTLYAGDTRWMQKQYMYSFKKPTSSRSGSLSDWFDD